MPPLFLNASRIEYYIPVGYENYLITEQGNLFPLNCLIVEKLKQRQIEEPHRVYLESQL